MGNYDQDVENISRNGGKDGSLENVGIGIYLYREREKANMGICCKILSELENMRRWRQDMAKPFVEMPDEGHQMGDVWKQE